jgi:glycosyltransferase involved in cell wall biosynthesis
MKTKTTQSLTLTQPVSLSVVIPCFNEQLTVQACIERVFNIKDDGLELEIIFVDDCSTDNSVAIAKKMAQKHPELTVLQHNKNLGKGSALKTGIQQATGQIVAIQDADLEYNPQDLRRLIQPIIVDEADVVFGSRFATASAYRVLYFWHSLGNKFLTLLSNIFTDLNMSDMECCYKVFRRELIQQIEIQESRFGIEPELVSKMAHLRPRIFEIGVSYAGRTYEEGKKIGFKDGLRALYCIFHYNAGKLPVPLQFLIYLLIGGISAIANIVIFLGLRSWPIPDNIAIPASFFLAALLNYVLCVAFLFRHKARWNSTGEILTYFLVVILVSLVDFAVTKWLLFLGSGAWLAKSIACVAGLIFNFVGRRYIVFPEPSSGPWRAQAAVDLPSRVVDHAQPGQKSHQYKRDV